MKNKCLVTFILLDLLGHPIKNAKYQIKNGNNLIAEGLTNSKGAIVDISRDKGVVLDVYFQNILNQMQLISRVCLEKRANSNMRCDSFKSHMIINKLSKFL